jgi:hypothetical protein
MSEKNVVNKKPGFRIIPRISKVKKDLGKYMEPQQDVREELSPQELQIKFNEVTKQITSLGLMLRSKFLPVDWLQNWDSFEFSSDVTLAEIPGKQHIIEIWVRGLLADYVANSGVMYTVTKFVWVPGNNDHEFTLEAYLNPPAQVMGQGYITTALSLNPGAAPATSGNISPMSPTQPPPPNF